MYGINDLKEKASVTEDHVECPVKGCKVFVERQRKQSNPKDERFKCPIHRIFVSPSTFMYESELSNLLWSDQSDLKLLNEILRVKRESRIDHENSEDAVSWNVFRYLERNKLLSAFAKSITGTNSDYADMIWWSYSQKKPDSWSYLDEARIEFGEQISRGSEPDMILLTNTSLIFIEAKVLAGNKTSGSKEVREKRLNEPKEYINGGGDWFSAVFQNDYKTLITDQKYELMRFWLLGSWIADQNDLSFYLVNLVLQGRELNIEEEFGKHIIQESNRFFKRISWEHIYDFNSQSGLTNPDTNKITNFYKTKALGYGSNRKLIKAFNVS